MNWKTRTIIAASLGLSCSASACARCGTASDKSDTSGPPATTDGTGTVGSNGLKPCAYTKYQSRLTTVMGKPLPNSLHKLKKDRDWGGILDGGSDGVEVMVFTLQCALGTRQLIPSGTGGGGVGGSVTGEGLLKDGTIYTTWLDGGLSNTQMQDIHTCLATRMNYINGVEVWMEGKDVGANRVPLDLTKYPIVEGYWGSVIDAGDVTTYFFQPTMSISGHDGKNTADPVSAAFAQALTDRVRMRYCSDPDHSKACHLYMPDSGTCQQGASGWTCTDLSDGGIVITNAVETRLTCCECCTGPWDAGLCISASGSDGGPLCDCTTLDAGSCLDAGSSSSGGFGGCSP